DLSGVRKLAEIPFDFGRKRVSVVVEAEGQTRLIIKGAFHHVLEVCTHTATGAAMDSSSREQLEAHYQAWSAQGILVLAVAWTLGVRATDREILEGRYGFAPPGQQRLVLGHESLGAVEAAPEGCGLAPGDLVVGVVRRPDPVPCLACAAGEWDMCRNGRYTERGIKERHGYGA